MSYKRRKSLYRNSLDLHDSCRKKKKCPKIEEKIFMNYNLLLGNQIIKTSICSYIIHLQCLVYLIKVLSYRMFKRIARDHIEQVKEETERESFYYPIHMSHDLYTKNKGNDLFDSSKKVSDLFLLVKFYDIYAFYSITV